jgi:hypothetical protein
MTQSDELDQKYINGSFALKNGRICQLSYIDAMMHQHACGKDVQQEMII